MQNQIILQGEGIDTIFAQLQQLTQLFQSAMLGHLPIPKDNAVGMTKARYSITETIKKLGTTKPTYIKYREKVGVEPLRDEKGMYHTEEHVQKLFKALYPNLNIAA